MKKFRLIIQPPAFEDLDAAYEWIRERAPDAAARWFNSISRLCCVYDQSLG
ncbi:MAG: hypothetical protein ACYC0X_14910 [Pirellulaceae bacterium]